MESSVLREEDYPGYGGRVGCGLGQACQITRLRSERGQ